MFLQAMLFFPFLLLLIIGGSFYGTYLICQLINSILEWRRKDQRLRSWMIATIVSIVTLAWLLSKYIVATGPWFN